MSLAPALSPRGIALLAGLLYLGEGAGSVFGQLIVPGNLVRAGDPTGTAARKMRSSIRRDPRRRAFEMR